MTQKTAGAVPESTSSMVALESKETSGWGAPSTTHQAPVQAPELKALAAQPLPLCPALPACRRGCGVRAACESASPGVADSSSAVLRTLSFGDDSDSRCHRSPASAPGLLACRYQSTRTKIICEAGSSSPRYSQNQAWHFSNSNAGTLLQEILQQGAHNRSYARHRHREHGFDV